MSPMLDYFTQDFTFAFAFVILKAINPEIMLFRFALMSVSMVTEKRPETYPKSTSLVFYTITHKKITELIPKQFRFGNSSIKITEYNSHSNSVKDSEILCSHCLPRPINSRNKSVR